MPGRLDRYVAAAVLSAYGATLLFLTAMTILFDLLFQLDTYLEAARRQEIGTLALMGMLAEYHLFNLPVVFVTIAPFVTVIACMFGLARLMAANEVGPMIFTGRSTFRVLRPMLGVGLFSALAMGTTWEWVMPSVAEERARLSAILLGETGDVTLRNVSLRSKDDARQEFFCLEYRHGQQRMNDVAIIHRGTGHSDMVLIQADAATWDPERRDWELLNGWRVEGAELPRTVSPQARLKMEGVTPEVIKDTGKERKQVGTMSYSELIDMMELRPGKRDYRLAFHTHFTFPLANLVLLLLALPFGVQFERGRRIERVVMAILICGGYLVLDLTCQNLAYKGFVDPVVAAWTPTIVFGSLGLVVFGGMRT